MELVSRKTRQTTRQIVDVQLCSKQVRSLSTCGRFGLGCIGAPCSKPVRFPRPHRTSRPRGHRATVPQRRNIAAGAIYLLRPVGTGSCPGA